VMSMPHTLDKPSLQERIKLPLEMQMGEMLQTHHPHKLLQLELPLEMQIEGASLVIHHYKLSLLEHLSETMHFQTSEVGIGEIWIPHSWVKP